MGKKVLRIIKAAFGGPLHIGDVTSLTPEERRQVKRELDDIRRKNEAMLAMRGNDDRK